MSHVRSILDGTLWAFIHRGAICSEPPCVFFGPCSHIRLLMHEFCLRLRHRPWQQGHEQHPKEKSKQGHFPGIDEHENASKHCILLRATRVNFTASLVGFPDMKCFQNKHANSLAAHVEGVKLCSVTRFSPLSFGGCRDALCRHRSHIAHLPLGSADVPDFCLVKAEQSDASAT